MDRVSQPPLMNYCDHGSYDTCLLASKVKLKYLTINEVLDALCFYPWYTSTIAMKRGSQFWESQVLSIMNRNFWKLHMKSCFDAVSCRNAEDAQSEEPRTGDEMCCWCLIVYGLNILTQIPKDSVMCVERESVCWWLLVHGFGSHGPAIGVCYWACWSGACDGNDPSSSTLCLS